MGCQVGNFFKWKFCSWQSTSENVETSSGRFQLWCRFCGMHWYFDRLDGSKATSRDCPESGQTRTGRTRNNTESAVKCDEIVGARVGKIETFPWEEKPAPEILKPVEQLLGELMAESNYTDFGMKKDDKIYRSMLLSTKSTTRGQGIAGKVSYQNVW